jgi:hypothetical protein
MGAGRLLVLASLWLLTSPAAAADRPASIRVGNLANKGELARFERRVREGCGHDARIRRERHASDKPPGRVIGQHPPRGTRIGCDHATATLHISAGPARAQLYVPALIDPARRRAFARQLKDACGTPVAIAETRRRSPLPPGRFVDQKPAQGMRYRCGDPVEIRLSAGPRGEALAVVPQGARDRKPDPAQAEPRATAPRPQPGPAAPAEAVPAPSAEALPSASPAVQPVQPPRATPRVVPPAPPAPAEPVAPAATTATAPPPPATPSRQTILGAGLTLLLLAALLVPLLRRRRRPAPAPAGIARTAPPPPPVAPQSPQSPPAPPAPLAPLLALERGWPTATARLLPLSRIPPGPPVDALPPVPLLRDLLRPLDPALDWIADTPLAALGGRAAAEQPAGKQPAGTSAHTPAGGETLAPLRPAFAEALHFALLFELPPLLARAWAQAQDLPFQTEGAQRGWCSLAPHEIEVAVTPDLALTAAGLPVARPALRLRLRLIFPAARLYLRGSALDAFEPGAVHVSAQLEWAGQARPLAVLRPHALWSGQHAVTPPLALHANPTDPLRATA